MGGCWLGECHYLTQGNYEALSMMLICKKLLKQIGIDPARLRLEFVSASEGSRFAEVITDFTSQLKQLGPIGIDQTSNGNGHGIRVKLEAVQSLIPYIKLVERERLRVHFKTEEEYHGFFNSAETNRLFNELIVDKLAIKQIMLLLRDKPLSTGEIAEILDLSQSEVSRHLRSSAREGLVRFNESRQTFAPLR